MQTVEHPSLADLTTLGFGGTAGRLLRVTDREDLDTARRCIEQEEQVVVLGRGSNLFARDEASRLVLVQPAIMDGPVILSEDGTQVTVSAGAGLPLPVLLGFAARNGLSGLEGLCGIPGSVGGAVAMNAGSFGCTTGDRVLSVEVWTPREGIRIVPRDACEFGYRHFSLRGESARVSRGISSDLSEGSSGEVSGNPSRDDRACGCGSKICIILSATFSLIKGIRNDIQEAMRTFLARKKAVQPVHERSAGCVFRNPPDGLSAGRLLENAGFRGRTLGGVAFSARHANFLINVQGGTAGEALELMSLARQAVLAQTGILLEPEVRIVPCLQG